MRVIAGRLRSRRLHVPRGDTTRPTTDRVREALFSILTSRLDLNNVRVLDLYAGSGALGIEALSRGAGTATFVENSRKVATVLRRNLTDLELEDVSLVVQRPVLDFLKRTSGEASARFDMVFADPPYGLKDVSRLPGLIQRCLSHSGLCAIEHSSEFDFANTPGFVLTRRYGISNISLFGPVS